MKCPLWWGHHLQMKNLYSICWWRGYIHNTNDTHAHTQTLYENWCILPLQIPRLAAADVLDPGSGPTSPKATSHLAIPPPPLIPAPLLYSHMRVPTVPVAFIHTLRQQLDEILQGPGLDSTSTSPTIDVCTNYVSRPERHRETGCDREWELL